MGDPLWDTSTAQGRLLSTLPAAIAEFERELIRERTSEGRKRAMARGVKFGRPSKLTLHQHAEALVRLAAGESVADVAIIATDAMSHHFVMDIHSVADYPHNQLSFRLVVEGMRRSPILYCSHTILGTRDYQHQYSLVLSLATIDNSHPKNRKLFPLLE